MKRALKWVYVTAIVCLLGVTSLGMTGCWEWAGGATAGAITMDTLMRQAEEDLAENIRLLDEKNAELRRLYEEAETAEDKARIEQAIAANIELTRKLEAAKQIPQVVGAARETDWADPAQVSTFGIVVLSLLANYLQGRSGKQKDKHVLGLNKGIQRFEGEHDKDVAGELHDTVKNELLKVGNGTT